MRLSLEAEEEVAGQSFTAYAGTKDLLKMSVEKECERSTSTSQLGTKRVISILSFERLHVRSPSYVNARAPEQKLPKDCTPANTLTCSWRVLG